MSSQRAGLGKYWPQIINHFCNCPETRLISSYLQKGTRNKPIKTLWAHSLGADYRHTLLYVKKHTPLSHPEQQAYTWILRILGLIMGMCCPDLWGTLRPMSSTAGDEGQSGQFGAKEVRTHRLPLVSILNVFEVSWKCYQSLSNQL